MRLEIYGATFKPKVYYVARSNVAGHYDDHEGRCYLPMPKNLTWEAPERVFISRPKEFFKEVGIVALVVCGILALAQQFALVLVIAALYFVAYALSTVPPAKVTHIISEGGVVTGGKEYSWEALEEYWFSEKNGAVALNVKLAKEQLPRVLFMILDGVKKEEVEKILGEHLRERALPPESWEEKLIKNISAKLAVG